MMFQTLEGIWWWWWWWW